MTLAGTIRIADLDAIAAAGGALHEEAAVLAAAAEDLRDVHRDCCGCDDPGAPACRFGPGWRILHTFVFDDDA